MGDRSSDTASVISGIPQGSILGPIQFILYINDLPDCFQSYCKIFADDTKVYNAAYNKDVLPQDLNNLQKWTEKWCLYLNVLKCKGLHIGSINENHEDVPSSESDNNTNIMKCTGEKDLGVIFDKDLIFDTHVQSAINKAKSMLGIIRRTFSFLNKDILLQLYTT